MTAGLNSRPKEWSRPPEPHPPDAGCWCSRNKRTVCELDLVQHTIRSSKRAQTLDPNQRPENSHEPLNLTCPCEPSFPGPRCDAKGPAMAFLPLVLVSFR